MYSVIPQATTYIVLQMLLYKQIFGWLVLNDSTREERCKTVHFQEFSWLAQEDSESLTRQPLST